MGRCRYCQREIPEHTGVCPYPDCGRKQTPEGTVGRILPPPPPPGTLPPPPGPVSMPPPGAPGGGIRPPAPPPPLGIKPPGPPTKAAPPPAAETRSAPPPLPAGSAPIANTGRRVETEIPPAAPPPPGAELDRIVASAAPELREQFEGLQRQVRAGRRRSFWLANGAAVAVLLGAILGGSYYLSVVYAYAELDDEVKIHRDDRDRVSLAFLPKSGGKVGFRRADVDRESELLDRVGGDALGKQQSFEWRVAGLKQDDAIRVTYRQGLKLVTRELPVPALAKETTKGKAVLCGEVVNAINKNPVEGAEVRIAGTPRAVKTDSKGRFRLADAPEGEVPVEVSAAGFSTEQFSRTLVPGEEEAIRVVISPGLKAGQIRLVLTWGKKPDDLDAHLEGPLPGGEKFHIYYHEQGDLKSKQFVHLDVDDQDGEGPETITVLGTVPGTYRYYVHDYSNRDTPNSGELAHSGAMVKVYQSGQTHTYKVDPTSTGNLWNVCNIEVKGNEAKVCKTDTFEAKESAAMGLYAKRTQANRAEWIGRYGGNEASEQAVVSGLEWLARHQAPDGSWANRNLGDGPETRCDPKHPCQGSRGGTYEMAHTGLAVLAFQAGGHYHFNNNTYSDVVRKGLEWMRTHQGPDGSLIGSAHRPGAPQFPKQYMYEHGIAAFAMSEALALENAQSRDKPSVYQDPVERAIQFVYANQHYDGGWRYNDKLAEESDTSITGWQVLALKSAKEAGLPVRKDSVAKIRKYFEDHRGDNGRTGYTGTSPITDATTGVGMIARQFLLEEPDSLTVHLASDYLAQHAQNAWSNRTPTGDSRDFYLWYNCTLGMFQAGGEAWERWNSVVRDTLIGLQRHDGCERGSWDTACKWGEEGGRIFTTALAALTLQVYYRYASHHETAAAEDGVVTRIETLPSGEKEEKRSGGSADEKPSP